MTQHVRRVLDFYWEGQSGAVFDGADEIAAVERLADWEGWTVDEIAAWYGWKDLPTGG